MADHQSAVSDSPRLWVVTGAIVAGLAVVLGAFGAHGAEAVLLEVHQSAEPKTIAGMDVPASYKYLQDYRTAAAYQMTHAVAIILVGLLGRRGKARIFGHAAAGCFLAGILLFCGSLYVIALTGLTWFGRVAPIGGLLFIVGWLLFATAALPRSRPVHQ